VVDVPAGEEKVADGYTEQVLVSPALPATAPCVQPPTDDPTSDPTSGPTGSQGAPAPAAVSSPHAAVLPNTGNGIPPWMAPTGVAAMLAGIAVIRFSRRPGVR